jgi:hypothetical protein
MMKRPENLTLEFIFDFVEQQGSHGSDPRNCIGLKSGIVASRILDAWGDFANYWGKVRPNDELA